MYIQITVRAVDWDQNKLVLEFKTAHNGEEHTYTNVTDIDMIHSYFDIMFDGAKRKMKDCLLKEWSEKEWRKRKGLRE